MTQLTQQDAEVFMLSLLLWREARGEDVPTKRVVAWSVRNRATHPSWWGRDWIGVITMHDQYSSLTYLGDPNLTRWPQPVDTSWMACMDVASEVYNGTGIDISHGATHYFDKSLDNGREPTWAKDGSMTWVMDSGNFHFWKRAIAVSA